MPTPVNAETIRQGAPHVEHATLVALASFFAARVYISALIVARALCLRQAAETKPHMRAKWSYSFICQDAAVDLHRCHSDISPNRLA